MSATTDASGDVATARPIPGHGSNRGLPFQRYTVVELARTSPIGTWTLDKVECSNVKEKPVRSARLMGATFKLTPRDPAVTCTFTRSSRADPASRSGPRWTCARRSAGPLAPGPPTSRSRSPAMTGQSPRSAGATRADESAARDRAHGVPRGVPWGRGRLRHRRDGARRRPPATTWPPRSPWTRGAESRAPRPGPRRQRDRSTPRPGWPWTCATPTRRRGARGSDCSSPRSAPKAWGQCSVLARMPARFGPPPCPGYPRGSIARVHPARVERSRSAIDGSCERPAPMPGPFDHHTDTNEGSDAHVQPQGWRDHPPVARHRRERRRPRPVGLPGRRPPARQAQADVRPAR